MGGLLFPRIKRVHIFCQFFPDSLGKFFHQVIACRKNTQCRGRIFSLCSYLVPGKTEIICGIKQSTRETIFWQPLWPPNLYASGLCSKPFIQTPSLSFASPSDAYSQSRSRDAFHFPEPSFLCLGWTKVSPGIYAERRFMMEESSLYVLSFATPTSLGHLVRSFLTGFSFIMNNPCLLLYARSFGRKFNQVCAFSTMDIRSAVMAGQGTVSGEIGILIRPGPSWTVKVSAMNRLDRIRGQKGTRLFNAVLSWGLQVDVSEQLYAMVEARKEANRLVVITCGIQYMIQRQFFLKAGLSKRFGNRLCRGRIRQAKISNRHYR